MPIPMTKKKQRKYFKNLRKQIYEEEYNKVKAQAMKDRRTQRVKEIREKAQRDAKMATRSGKERIKANVQRIQRGATKIQEKRVEYGKKVSPYLENLNRQFDISIQTGQQKRKNKFNPPWI